MGAVSQNAGNEHSEMALNRSFEAFKWIVAIGLVGGAAVGNGYFSEAALLYRAIAVVACLILALALLGVTAKGRQFRMLLKEARVEMRKVVWPGRQETMQTTIGVLLIILLVTVLLFLLDTGLGKLVSWLIG